MRKIAFLTALALAAAPTAASAQTQSVSVQSLIDSGYTIAGITTSLAGGASIFLQKGNALFYCYAAETPTSPTVATKYCKPVK